MFQNQHLLIFNLLFKKPKLTLHKVYGLMIPKCKNAFSLKNVHFRFFVKTHGKQRKSAMSMRAKDKYNSKLTGPKPFPLERLLAIFYNIVEVIISFLKRRFT